MKLKTFALLLISIFAVFSVPAQEKKEKTKKSKIEKLKKEKSPQPKLAVAKIEEPPPPIAPVEQPKPANGSLFTANSVNGNLLSDFKARRVGDLLFVDVVETSIASVSSGAKRNRDSGNLGGIVPLINALPVNGAGTAGAVVSQLGQRKFEGKGSTERRSDVRSRITARVVEVLPNGDLRIEAVKLVKINKETEQLAVTGIVRISDVARDNSIPTTFIGDLRVDFNGKGVASADNAPGWLFRLFEKITPF